MKTLFLFFVLPFFIYSNQPDDIKLKNGSYLTNVKIIDSTQYYYVVKTSSGTRNINRGAITSVYFSPYDSTKESEFKSDIPKTREAYKYDPNLGTPENDGYEQPYLLMLAVSGTLAYLSYDYFASANEMGDNLSDKFEKIKTRYTIGGVVFGVAAVLNTIFALKKVKIINTNNSVGVSYNF